MIKHNRPKWLHRVICMSAWLLCMVLFLGPAIFSIRRVWSYSADTIQEEYMHWWDAVRACSYGVVTGMPFRR